MTQGTSTAHACSTAGCVGDRTGYVLLHGPNAEVMFCKEHVEQTVAFFRWLITAGDATLYAMDEQTENQIDELDSEIPVGSNA